MPLKAILLGALASTLASNAWAQLDKSLDGSDDRAQYKVMPDDSEEVRLMKQRINTYYHVCELVILQINAGKDLAPKLFEARKNLTEARLDFHDDGKSKVAVLKDELANAKAFEARQKQRYEGSASNVLDYTVAVAYRLDVELRLLRLEKQLAAAK